MYIDENKGTLVLNDRIKLDLRNYVQECYLNNPEMVNTRMLELIMEHNEKWKQDLSYIPLTNDEIAAGMTMLEMVWKSNKDKIEMIMDQTIPNIIDSFNKK